MLTLTETFILPVADGARGLETWDFVSRSMPQTFPGEASHHPDGGIEISETTRGFGADVGKPEAAPELIDIACSMGWFKGKTQKTTGNH